MIKDVTNSPKDWEDFWYSPEKYGSWEYYNSESEGRDIRNIDPNTLRYVDMLWVTAYAFKRGSRLSD